MRLPLESQSSSSAPSSNQASAAAVRSRCCSAPGRFPVVPCRCVRVAPRRGCLAQQLSASEQTIAPIRATGRARTWLAPLTPGCLRREAALRAMPTAFQATSTGLALDQCSCASAASRFARASSICGGSRRSCTSPASTQPREVAVVLDRLQQLQRLRRERHCVVHGAAVRLQHAGIPVRRGLGHRAAERLRLLDRPPAHPHCMATSPRSKYAAATVTSSWSASSDSTRCRRRSASRCRSPVTMARARSPLSR